MTRKKWLERFDAHMKRGEEIMRRSDETMRRSDETMRRSDETMKLLRADHEDLRRFLREEGIRRDKALRGFEKRMDDAGDQLRANTAATWAMVDEMSRWRG